MIKRVTTHEIRSMKTRGELIPMLTAYDFTSAAIAERAGVPLVLVGDSFGHVVLGYSSTIPVTLDDMVLATAAVVRGTQKAMVVADMPFMTYQESPEQAMRSAARLMQVGGAHAVKLEGGSGIATTVRKLTESGIAVMGHIGFTPQSINQIGGYRVQGKDEKSSAKLLNDARALEHAGCFAIVLELVPAEVAGAITTGLSIPTIGIGAGPACDGQVQVWHDLLGLLPDFKPRHARRYAELATIIQEAVSKYVADVKSKAFPSEAESFHLPSDQPQVVPGSAGVQRNGRTPVISPAMPGAWTPERIRTLRETLRMTQLEMSGRVGVAKNNLSAWERGRKHPSLRHQGILDTLAREAGLQPK
ncbi:MAG: 3-methyl-2-oxobutanoate hydroxymethyltransferase [Chloroflexi bacterium]|nr:3-methyl-2-oxobutanoate hydroxymethyltransferase [Chloroflexota bacterium]